MVLFAFRNIAVGRELNPQASKSPGFPGQRRLEAMLVGHSQPFASIVSLPRFFLILTLAVGIGKNASQVAILLGQSKIVGCQGLFLGCGKAGLRGGHCGSVWLTL